MTTLHNLDSVIARLEALAVVPPLKVTVSDGGMPEPWTFEPDQLVLIGRRELLDMAAALKGTHLTARRR